MISKNNKRIYSVRCKSGLKGWRCRLRAGYDSFEEFHTNDRLFGLAPRLGFDSAAAAWLANPVVEGSIRADDFREVK